MLKNILLVIFTCYSMATQGQVCIGLSGGPTITQFSNGKEERPWITKNYIGYTISIPIVYKLDEHMALQSGISF